MAEARVSVLVTTYGHERYVARALEGALDQRGVSFELLVGDDASTDGTRAVIERYAEAHPDVVRTFFPERNLGQGGKALFAELLKRARGEYVVGVDGDDFWTSARKLERQVAYMDDHPDCSMCFHDVLCHHEDGTRPDTRFGGSDTPAEVDLHRLLEGIQIAWGAPLFRRAAIHPLPEWYFELPFKDAPCYVLAAAHGSIHYLPDVMGVYRFHAGGRHRGLPRRRALERRVTYFERVRLPAAYEAHRRRRLAETWVKLGLEHERLGDRRSARDCLAESVRVDRSRVRRRSLLRLLLRTPARLTGHPRLAAWRQRRVEGHVAPRA